MEGKSNLDSRKEIADWLQKIGIPQDQIENISTLLSKQDYQKSQDLVSDPPSVAELERWNVPGRWAKKIFGALEKLGQPTASQTRKSFAYGPAVGDGNYHVPFETLQLPRMVKRVEEGGCSMVIGGFRTGKTSHKNALKRKLSNSKYFAIDIYFREPCTSSNFWFWIGTEINRNIPIKNRFDSITDFSDFLVNFPKDKKLVLLLDEFQFLNSMPEIKKQLLVEIKMHMDNGDIHSVLAFGTLTIHLNTKLTEPQIVREWKELFSPFPYANTIYVDILPDVEVGEMFKEWSKDRKIDISKAILNDIIETCGGYPGIVGVVGSSLDGLSEFALPPHSNFPPLQWISIKSNLPDILLSSDQFSRLRKVIESSSEFKNFLLYQAIGADAPLVVQEYVPNNKTDHLLESLADYGLFSRKYGSAQTTFVFSATPIYHLVLKILSNERTFITSEVPPIEIIGDIPTLIQDLVVRLDSKILSRRETHNSTSKFPSESTFQALFFFRIFSLINSINSLLFEPKWFVIPEGKSDGKRCDLLIGNGERTVIELKAHKSYDEPFLFKNDLQQTKQYATLHQCNRAILINFSTETKNFDQLEDRYGTPQMLNIEGVYVFEVQMNATYDKFKWKPISQNI
eukprot:TRINITY_DN483_c0_g3_i2.p1 TRINITY_DN483_c0_g3~~TRINITY_DN483_c0_g3_i2.p1  ORF type:complete len:626 (+),score=102.46 TRINITY_DN483_c0_g3_i2:131-2008(+)